MTGTAHAETATRGIRELTVDQLDLVSGASASDDFRTLAACYRLLVRTLNDAIGGLSQATNDVVRQLR